MIRGWLEAKRYWNVQTRHLNFPNKTLFSSGGSDEHIHLKAEHIDCINLPYLTVDEKQKIKIPVSF